jgi:hypothetical protein
VVTQMAVSSTAGLLSTWWRKAKRRPASFFRSYLELCILTQQNLLDTFGPVVQTDFTGENQVTLDGDVVQVRAMDVDGGEVGEDSGGDVGVDVRQVSFDGGQLPFDSPQVTSVDYLITCAHVWKGEKGGSKRPVGCGDRLRCPLCADYYHATQAREGIAMVGAVLDAGDSLAIARDTFGEHIEFTLPKDFSAALDLLLNVDCDYYRDKINRLRRAAWRCVKKVVKQACLDADLPGSGELGAVIVFHHWGSSAPWEPHYHFHLYLLPYTADLQDSKLINWRSLPRWWSEGSLAMLRSSWKKAVQRILEAKYAGEWDVSRGYLNKKSKMLHFMAYQMRAPLRDLWKGVRGDETNGFEYHVKGKPGRPGKDLPVTPEQFRVAVRRAGLIGSKVTRVTWYGLLANANQTGTMEQLGLNLDLVMDEDEDMIDKTKYWRVVDVTDLGVLFKTTADGSEEVDFVAWDKLRPDPGAAPCERPIGAKRRRRWVLPGKRLDSIPSR